MASFVRRSTWLRVVARNSRRVLSSRSSSASSSRKPASENSGVRSSCEALATNSFRALVELRQLDPHPVERGGELADLVVAAVDDRLVERALGDPVGRPLQAPEPPRMDRGDGEPEHDRDQQGRHGRVQQPPLDERDGGELVRERAREEHHVAGGEQRHGHLRVLAALVPDAGADRPDARRRRRAPSSPSRSRSRRPAAESASDEQRPLRRASPPTAKTTTREFETNPALSTKSVESRGCSAPPAPA